MPGTWPFNRVSTQDRYVTATTAQFPIGRGHFTVQVYTAGVFYRLIAHEPPSFYYEDPEEHFLGPVLGNFDSPLQEGLAYGQLFGGIMFRSAVAGTPASVTVI